MSISWRKLKKEIVDTCEKFDNIFLMMSGGVDSVFLADFITRNTDLPINILHFQHGIRSDDHLEVELVKKFCCHHNIQYHIGHGDNLRDAKNQESVAREQRITFINNVIDFYQGSRIVLTAHHFDDQIENFFMSAVRGRSVSSLVMKRLNDFGNHVKYKPLLEITKEQIYKQAKFRKLKWIEDPTNQELDHERNIFRNSIIPSIKDIRNISKSMRRLISELEDM